jgi:hypothetical protein
MYIKKNNILSKDFKNFIFLVYLGLILLISIWYLDSLFLESLCDSTSVHDFVNDTVIISSEGEVSKFTRLYNSFKCKVSWYALDKDNPLYSSYNEYKKSWNTNTRLRDIIKADLARSRAETLASINRKKKYDDLIWKSKWARRVNETFRYNEKRRAAYEYSQRHSNT